MIMVELDNMLVEIKVDGKVLFVFVFKVGWVLLMLMNYLWFCYVGFEIIVKFVIGEVKWIDLGVI